MTETDLTNLTTEELKKRKRMIENNYDICSNKKQVASDYDDILAEIKNRKTKKSKPVDNYGFMSYDNNGWEYMGED